MSRATLKAASKKRGSLKRFGSFALAAFLALPPAAPADPAFDEALARYKSGDHAGAYALFKPMAQSGQAAAQYYVGMMRLTGQGTGQDDAKAVAWFQKAAEGGIADAAFVLGDLYAEGSGVPRDPEQAEKWTALAKSLNKGEDWDDGCD